MALGNIDLNNNLYIVLLLNMGKVWREQIGMKVQMDEKLLLRK